MFQQIIIDHQDNTAKNYLDKDYFYKKRFQVINDMDQLMFRNEIGEIIKKNR